MTYSGQCTCFNPETLECVFGQADLIGSYDRGVIHHVERCRNALLVGDDFYFGQCLKASDPIHQAVAVQVNNVFEIGIDCDAFEFEVELLFVLRGRARIVRSRSYMHEVTIHLVMVI